MKRLNLFIINFRKRPNFKKKKKRNIKFKDGSINKRTQPNQILVHGLLKCNTCHRIWNRDLNASLNIREIAMSQIWSQERPQYLRQPAKKERTNERGDNTIVVSARVALPSASQPEFGLGRPKLIIRLNKEAVMSLERRMSDLKSKEEG